MRDFSDLNKYKGNNKFRTVDVVCLVLISCIISIISGVFLHARFSGSNPLANNSFNKDLEELNSVYNEIINDYYGSIDKDKLIEGAIEGMLGALDDSYSTIIDKSQSDNFNITLEGDYEGLGIEIISTDNGIYVLKVFDGSPANEAGIKVGDIITAIDEIKYHDMSTEQFSDYVRNSKKDNLNVKINRNDEEIEVEIKRRRVTINSITSKIINKNEKKVGYIYVSIFASNTFGQFKDTLANLEDKEIDCLIIDLRDNTGGHLSAVANMLSLFLDSSHVIYQTDDGNHVEKFYSTGNETKEYPLYILVNESSASASEIMTGTLRDELGAIIIGKTTFGKGSVQELRTLSDGTQYKLTIKKWLTSGGTSVDGVGLTPDYVVELNQEYYNNPIDDNDTQLNKALELIK